MIRLFLDANALFTTARNPEGKAFFIISLGLEGLWEVYTSTFAAEETRRNLAVKYPSAEEIFDELLAAITIVHEQTGAPYPATLNEKDRPIFQAAHACRASHLITGDLAHFGSFMCHKTSAKGKPDKTLGLIILTPARFLLSL